MTPAPLETNRTKSSLGDLSEDRVAQDGPQGPGDFIYIDIGSIDRETKRIIGAKVLQSSKAPSRARQVLRKGDVVVSMTRPNLNAVAIVPPDLDGAIGSTGFHVLRAKDAEPHFLFYAVQTPDFVDEMSARVQGALYPAIRPRDISSFAILAPPRSDQRRIVSEIEEQLTKFEVGVNALRRAHVNVGRFRAAILQAAFDGHLVLADSNRERTEDVEGKRDDGKSLLARILSERRTNLKSRGRYEEPSPPRIEDLPPLPRSWTWVTIEQLLRNDSGLGYGILKPGREDPYGVPMIRVMDIGDGKLSGTEILRVDPKLSDEFKRTVLESGDILLAVMATVGRCTVVPEHLVGANVNRALAVIKPTHLVSSKFMELAIRSPRIQHLFQMNKIGSAQARINLSSLRTYCLPLPPRDEQERIVQEVERRLSVVEKIEAAISRCLQRASRLRQAILQRAFFGSAPLAGTNLETGKTALIRSYTEDAMTTWSVPRTLMSKIPTLAKSTVLEILANESFGVTPEDLFVLSGRNPANIDQVEEFFAELRELLAEGRIEELRVNKASVVLRAKS